MRKRLQEHVKIPKRLFFIEVGLTFRKVKDQILVVKHCNSLVIL